MDYCGLLLIVMVTKDKDEVRDNWKDSTLWSMLFFLVFTNDKCGSKVTKFDVSC